MSHDPIELLTANEVCREKKISLGTFYRLRKIGVLPEGEPVGLRGRRWKRGVIDAAFAAAQNGKAA